jgi:hypothetical protein
VKKHIGYRTKQRLIETFPSHSIIMAQIPLFIKDTYNQQNVKEERTSDAEFIGPL